MSDVLSKEQVAAYRLGLHRTPNSNVSRVLSLCDSHEALRAEIASVWWVLGRSYQDQYGTLADAMKDVGKRLQAAENPPDWSAGFVSGKETNDFLAKAANMRAEALRAEVARLKVQQMQFRGWLDHACSLIGGEEASYVIGVVDKLGFASPFDSSENSELLRLAARDTARAEGGDQ